MNLRHYFLQVATLLAVAFCLTACLPGDLIGILDDDDPTEEPTNPSNPTGPSTNKNTVTVTPEGSKVTRGNFSINFPKGTFTEDVQVTVDDATASDVTASPARSKFNKVSLPAVGTKKNIKMTLKCDGSPDDAMMIVQQKGWNRHTGETQDQVIDIASTVSDDARVATIDNFDATNGEKITFTVGLIDDVMPTRSETRTYTTRAGAKYAFTVTYDLGFNVKSKEWWRSFLGTYYAKKDEMVKVIQDYLPKAFEKLSDNGYDMIPVTDTLKYYITTTNDDGWGGYVNSMIKTTWGVVNLNVERVFNNLDKDPLKATLVHETLHAIYDRVYDKRSAWDKYYTGINGDIWTMLDESIGSWAEKLSEQGVINKEVTPQYAPLFIQSFAPVKRDYLNCRNHGYGMALFIEYLSQKTSNKDITKLYEYRRNAGSNDLDMYDALQTFFNEKHLRFGDTQDFLTFVLDVLDGKLSDAFDFHDGAFYRSSARLEPIRAVNDIYSMGGDVRCYSFNCSSDADKTKLEKDDMFVTQGTEGLVTYVYGIKKKRLTSPISRMGYEHTLLGTARKGEPCTISGKTVRDEYKGEIAFITFKEVSNYLSVTSSQNQKGAQQELFITFGSVSVEPTSITFPAEGGSKKVKVNYGTYKRYGYKVLDADRSWISAENTSGVTVTFTAQPNTTGRRRETTVYCYVTNVENSTEAERVYMPVKVMQEANADDKAFIPVKVTFDLNVKSNNCRVWSTGDIRTSQGKAFWSQYFDCYRNVALGVSRQDEFIEMTEDEHGVHFNCYTTYTEGETKISKVTFDLDNLDKLADGTAEISNIKCEYHWYLNERNDHRCKFSTNATLSMDAPLRKCSGPYDLPGWNGANWEMKGTAVQFNNLEYKEYDNGQVDYYYSSIIPDEENKVRIFLAFLRDASASSAPRRRVPLRNTPGCASEEAPTAP